MYLMIDLANTDRYILAAIAIDRAVTISVPPHYTTIMSTWLCLLLVVGSWGLGCLDTPICFLILCSQFVCPSVATRKWPTSTVTLPLC
jgi:hypothetical protein